MKNFIRVIGIFFTIAKVQADMVGFDQDPYLSDNIVASIQNISISKLLDFKKIAVAIHDDYDKARFHYIIAYEIDRRKQALDQKFYEREQKYQKAIISYENEQGLTPYQYAYVNYSYPIYKDSVGKFEHDYWYASYEELLKKIKEKYGELDASKLKIRTDQKIFYDFKGSLDEDRFVLINKIIQLIT